MLHPAVKGMEKVYFGLLFNLIWTSSGLPQSRTPMLIIHPPKPLVELGGSIQLNCSMTCPGGKVQWEGLDTELGNVISTNTYSILTVTNATVRSEGVKICTGQCRRKHFQNKVDLKVYSLPDTLQLETQPKKLITGQSAHIFCSVTHVYPPGSLILSWFRGDGKLVASKNEEEEEEEEEQLFMYRSELEIPITAKHTSYKCEAKLEVEQQTFHRSKIIMVDTKVTQVMPTAMKTITTLEPIGTSHRASSELSTTTIEENLSVATTGHLMAHQSTRNPTVAATEITDTAAPTLGASTSSPTALGKISTGLSSPAQDVVGEMSRMATTSTSSSTSTFPPATENLAKVSFTSPGPPTATKQPRRPSSTKLLSTMDTTGKQSPSVNPRISCRPVITTIPQQGTTGESLRISCHATECSNSVQVQWVETPLAESQYYKEEAEGHSTLMVESISLEHQGIYQCITLTSQPQMARVRIMVSPAIFSTSSIVAIGTAGPLLGLIITGYVSRRLWQRSS